MEVSFQYDKEKDIWCLLNKGKSSSNSQTATKPYEQLVAAYGDNLTPETTATFIEKYLLDNRIDLQRYIADYQKDWDSISAEYYKRAEAIFGVSLPNDIKAYLTVNTRCPYSIENNYFFVSVSASSIRKTAMHELWHFYTWYGLGVDQEQKLGKQKYNDLKEALTVLLNVECKELLPEGASDNGYPQHKEIRGKILEYWAKDRNITNLWNHLTTTLN